MFWLFENIKNYDAVALIDEHQNKQISYRELIESSDNISSIFTGQRKLLVFLFTGNRASDIIYYVSILRSKNAVFLADAKMDKSLKDNLIKIYKPDIIISNSSDDYYDGYEHAAGENLFYKIDNDVIEIDENLGVLLSTSGTTGSSKLVRLSYDNLSANAESISGYLQLDDTEKAITSLPMSYSYGLSVINSHLLAGASIVCTDKSMVMREFWQVFNVNECTSFSGVPYNYQILKKLKFESMSLPSLRTMTQAGGRLSEELIKFFYDVSSAKGIRFFVMYGQTEATARISYVPYNNVNAKIGSAGIAIPGGEINICDESGNSLNPYEEGELVYSGRNVMMGYAVSRECLSKGDELNGILQTGDLAYKDKDGFVFITGRIKRFIKLFGLRINLDEIEKYIENVFSVHAACVGSDDSLKILIESEDPAMVESVKERIKQVYKIHNSVFKVGSIDHLPVTQSGKRNYREVEKVM